MVYVHKKHFTLAEARTMLAAVKPLAEELVTLKKKLDERGFDIYRHQYFGGTGPNGDRFFPAELERLVEVLKELEATGVLVKGIGEGLVDFPCVRSNGEEVYLCFKADEERIEYWHSLEGGFAGRQPIENL